MRVGLIIADLLAGAALWGGFLVALRAARSGRRIAPRRGIALAFALVLWLPANGFVIGYALASVTEGVIGAAGAGALVMIVGPLIRIRQAQRNRG